MKSGDCEAQSELLTLVMDPVRAGETLGSGKDVDVVVLDPKESWRGLIKARDGGWSIDRFSTAFQKAAS